MDVLKRFRRPGLVAALLIPSLALGAEDAVDTGITAWILTALALLMVPDLAMFCGGQVRTKNVLGTMMHSVAAMGIIQPDKLDDVRETLIAAAITRITVNRCTGHGRASEEELYPGQRILSPCSPHRERPA